MYYINLYKSTNSKYGYNIQDGGHTQSFCLLKFINIILTENILDHLILYLMR